MTKFIFLLSLAALCCISIYQTEVRLLSSSSSLPSTDTTIMSLPNRLTQQKQPPWRPYDNALQTTRITKTIHWQGKNDLKRFMRSYFDSENLLCRHVWDDERNRTAAQTDARSLRDLSSLPTQYILNITIGCRKLFETAGLGTGNFMAGMYALRLAAHALASKSKQRSFRIVASCKDASDEKANLILPWLMGVYDSAEENEEWQSSLLLKYYSDRASLQHEACNNIDKAPIGLLYPEMQYELRRMAVRSIGIPPKDHVMHDAVKQWVDSLPLLSQHFQSNHYSLEVDPSEPPLYPNVSLDDAILHFRCGDLMDSNHPRFGFLRFQAFAKHIPTTSKSIGIVTQPFDASSDTVRALDASDTKTHRCRVVVTDFIDYLKSLFPHARIQLHNSPDETIALTYARMIMAQATIAGISTFGVFASIASFGTGYIRRPDDKSATNEWLIHPKALDEIMTSQSTQRDGVNHDHQPQLVLMDEPDILMVRRVRELWLEEDGQEKILKWFRGKDL
jgi:hypothetical protein